MEHARSVAAVRRDEGILPMIVAHRGAWQQAPQNSLDAVREAAVLGCDGIEIDVRRTADGRIVVVHDARVRWRQVGRLDHREVQARLRVGQAPLLSDVLDQAAGRLLVDVELKEDGYVEEAMALVAQRLTPQQYVVTSFLPRVLNQVKAHRPEARTGLLMGPRSARRAARHLHESGADFLAPHISLTHAGVLEWAARRDLASWVWTVNDPRTLQALSAQPSVAALITDAPADAMALFTCC
ncbi:MAG TPA: glycerophosphodiester phosphodiesterase [Solirubrobacteraceae bacterium]